MGVGCSDIKVTRHSSLSLAAAGAKVLVV